MTTTRTRIVEVAIDLTCRDGWSNVTMVRLAEAARVSRQTVYNEVGTRPALAEAMVLHELAGFLSVVEAAFDAHEPDVVASVDAATTGVLARAQDNPLLRAIVGARTGPDTELVPLLSTQSAAVLDAARSVISDRLARCAPKVPSDQLTTAADVIVRTVLSHVTQPSGSPVEVGSRLGAAGARLLQDF